MKSFSFDLKKRFFLFDKKQRLIKKKIEKWIKKTHSILKMWKLRKIFNHLFQYSLKSSHSSHSRLISKSSFCSSCSSSCKHLLHSKFCRRIDSVMSRLIRMCSNSRCQCWFFLLNCTFRFFCSRVKFIQHIQFRFRIFLIFYLRFINRFLHHRFFHYRFLHHHRHETVIRCKSMKMRII
jgi:hypothetical protein